MRPGGRVPPPGRVVTGEASPAAVPTFTLLVRDGCHLCEDMAAQLTELFEPGRFALEPVDIDADPVLRARYDHDVPVLLDGEHELCRHFLDALAVTERLASYNEGISDRPA